jgi:hypothetical protein
MQLNIAGVSLLLPFLRLNSENDIYGCLQLTEKRVNAIDVIFSEAALSKLFFNKYMQLNIAFLRFSALKIYA